MVKKPADVEKIESRFDDIKKGQADPRGSRPDIVNHRTY